MQLFICTMYYIFSLKVYLQNKDHKYDLKYPKPFSPCWIYEKQSTHFN